VRPSRSRLITTKSKNSSRHAVPFQDLCCRQQRNTKYLAIGLYCNGRVLSQAVKIKGQVHLQASTRLCFVKDILTFSHFKPLNVNPPTKFKNTGFEIQGLLLFVSISEDGWLAPYNDDGMIMQVF
jgi:hypothetical protein